MFNFHCINLDINNFPIRNEIGKSADFRSFRFFSSFFFYLFRSFRFFRPFLADFRFLFLIGLLYFFKGMGKSFLLNNMAFKIKEQYKDHWIVLVNLNQHSKYFKSCNIAFNNDEAVISFLGNEVLKLKNDSEVKIFSHACNVSGKVQVLLDGVDEIAPHYTDAVTDMLKRLMKMNIARIIISTRIELENSLENLTEKIHHCLSKFSENDQKTYLLNFWKTSTNSENTSFLSEVADVVIKKV
jgi:hypothetical protein